jgi:selenide, water dikinase
MQTQPVVQDLVLIGGGHSHAIALKQWGMNPLPGVRLTLITDVSHTPYSGMLPAYVAGLYKFDDCHIDLRPLCQFAQATMILDQAVGLDLANNRILLANRPPIAFDLLSLDIGSTPTLATVPGAAEYTIPVKPISRFLSQWDQVVAEQAANQSITGQPQRMAVVGGGSGGVELALAIQARLKRLMAQAQKRKPSYAEITAPELHLFHRGSRVIPERVPAVGNRLGNLLAQQGVMVHLSESVSQITEQAGVKKISCESGLAIEVDLIFWVTQAAAAPWLAESGLATDSRGFMLINDCLQSVSHPHIFAAGDVATLKGHPRPKAGVFAVRQGKPLVKNLRRALQGQSLRPFLPQKEFLILIGTGTGSALASKGRLSLGPSPQFWLLKDQIDRQFMAQFANLKPMEIKPTAPQPTPAPCAGCGSKVGSTVLDQALKRIRHTQTWHDHSDVLVGLDQTDDAAVIQVPAQQVMVQTVDHFRALLSDPYVFGQICANHCLSDLFAMAANPQSALAIVTLPYAAEAKQAEMLYHLLSGAIKALTDAGATLVGGHTTEGSELAFGLTCNGLATPNQLWHKTGMQARQSLILTKGLGTGTLFAADMQLKAKGRWIEAAIASMLKSNQAAVGCLQKYGVTACTDVTGFGLLGHLMEMLRGSQLGVELNLNALPLLPGAVTTAAQGILSSLHSQNARKAPQMRFESELSQHPAYPMLFDPQTSGGLLASVPTPQAKDCVAALQKLGYLNSAVIGQTYTDLKAAMAQTSDSASDSEADSKPEQTQFQAKCWVGPLKHSS